MIEEVEKCCTHLLSALKCPALPIHKLEHTKEVLCDADIFHISNEHFYYRKILLGREWEFFCNNKVTDLERHQLNLEFLKKQHFRTIYGKSILKQEK